MPVTGPSKQWKHFFRPLLMILSYWRWSEYTRISSKTCLGQRPVLLHWYPVAWRFPQWAGPVTFSKIQEEGVSRALRNIFGNTRKVPRFTHVIIRCDSFLCKSVFFWFLLCLVGGLEHFLFFHILGIVTQLTFIFFQRGWNHQPGVVFPNALSVALQVGNSAYLHNILLVENL